MGAVIDFVTANPLYGAGIVLLLALLIVGVVKKMAKLAVIAVLLNVGYVYYLHDAAADYYQQAQRTVEGAAAKAADAADKTGALLR